MPVYSTSELINMKLNIPTAQNESELLSFLQKVDISVPLRIEGRKTEHAEKWSICRLLATLANQKLLQFPLSVLHRDKPDFTLYSGNCEIGIEITEAIPKEYAEYAALAEREFPDVFLQPGHFRWGCKKMSLTKMRQLLSEPRLSSPPWEGKSAESEWAAFMAASIRSKIVKLCQQHFLKLQQNWLVIYNNLPLPHVVNRH